MTERNIYELGYWDGDKWRFKEPFTMPNGDVVRTIDFSQMQIPPEVTRDEVVEALTDPEAVIKPLDGELDD